MTTEKQQDVQPYVPNKYSKTELWVMSICGIALFGYGLYCFMEGRLVLPARAGAFAVTGYLPTGIFFLGAASWAAGFLAVVVDHFDERDNESAYVTFQHRAHIAGLWLMGGGIIGGAAMMRFGL